MAREVRVGDLVFFKFDRHDSVPGTVEECLADGTYNIRPVLDTDVKWFGIPLADIRHEPAPVKLSTKVAEYIKYRSVRTKIQGREGQVGVVVWNPLTHLRDDSVPGDFKIAYPNTDATGFEVLDVLIDQVELKLTWLLMCRHGWVPIPDEDERFSMWVAECDKIAQLCGGGVQTPVEFEQEGYLILEQPAILGIHVDDTAGSVVRRTLRFPSGEMGEVIQMSGDRMPDPRGIWCAPRSDSDHSDGSPAHPAPAAAAQVNEVFIDLTMDES
jgi:hypothetical protein